MTAASGESATLVNCGFSSQEARDQAIISHMPRVTSIARKIQNRLPRHVELSDLLSAGTIGLIDAANRFDSSYQVTFATFSYTRISGAIFDSLRDEGFGSRDARTKSKEVDKVRGRLAMIFGRKPTESEMASTMHLPLGEYRSLLQDIWMLSVVSAHDERSAGEPGEGETGERDILLNLIPDKSAVNALKHMEKHEANSQLGLAVQALTGNQQAVIGLYYYLEMTMSQIGSILGINESNVSKTHAKALNTLRASMLRPSWAASGLDKSTDQPDHEHLMAEHA